MARRSSEPNYGGLVAILFIALVALFINAYINNNYDGIRDEATLEAIRIEGGIQ